MTNYRFFEFKTKDIEDYCRAENIKEAVTLFKLYHKNIGGKVKEVFMSQFNKDCKSWAGDK